MEVVDEVLHLDSPDEEGHIKSKLEALVKELHALHEHMDEDDDHLVEMHNAIKDKMRDAYNSGDPAGPPHPLFTRPRKEERGGRSRPVLGP